MKTSVRRRNGERRFRHRSHSLPMRTAHRRRKQHDGRLARVSSGSRAEEALGGGLRTQLPVVNGSGEGVQEQNQRFLGNDNCRNRQSTLFSARRVADGGEKELLPREAHQAREYVSFSQVQCFPFPPIPVRPNVKNQTFKKKQPEKGKKRQSFWY
jgi:hypothetical protein